MRSAEVALRSRRRQYQVRDLLEEQHRKRLALEEAGKIVLRAKEFDDAVMNNMAEGLYTVDTHGKVTFVNPAAERLFGWTGAELRGRTAQITVRFVSKLVSATRDRSGAVIDGNAEKVTDVTDSWTFARDVSSRDPNWKLVATEAGH